jgi:hypothetical protein
MTRTRPADAPRRAAGTTGTSSQLSHGQRPGPRGPGRSGRRGALAASVLPAGRPAAAVSGIRPE